MLPNTALQTDERRTLVAARRGVTLAPLAAERQTVMPNENVPIQMEGED
jgi:hypothetical protein